MGLYSLVCLVAKRLGQEELVKVQKTGSYKKEHVTFSDMLRTVRLIMWRENLIPRKGKITPFMKNIPPEMAEWTEAIVERILQAA